MPISIDLPTEFKKMVARNQGTWTEKNGIVVVGFPDGSKWDFTIPMKVLPNR